MSFTLLSNFPTEIVNEHFYVLIYMTFRGAKVSFQGST